jgi:hypothetical protein
VGVAPTHPTTALSRMLGWDHAALSTDTPVPAVLSVLPPHPFSCCALAVLHESRGGADVHVVSTDAVVTAVIVGHQRLLWWTQGPVAVRLHGSAVPCGGLHPRALTVLDGVGGGVGAAAVQSRRKTAAR